jgi:aspartyl-tRNA(Asn)/glutamyl-tRNA(Gln) amidotransferase subunit C
MAIDEKQVDHVAHLSRLNLTDGEKQVFARQMDSILEYVEKLDELDTEGVQPLVHIAPRENVFREDKTGTSLSRKQALQNAPGKTGGYFQVPRIIE